MEFRCDKKTISKCEFHIGTNSRTIPRYSRKDLAAHRAHTELSLARLRFLVLDGNPKCRARFFERWLSFTRDKAQFEAIFFCLGTRKLSLQNTVEPLFRHTVMITQNLTRQYTGR